MDHRSSFPGQARPILAYESAQLPGDDLNHEFEIAWAKSLRRRFLWYCGVIIAFSLPGTLIVLLWIFLNHLMDLVAIVSEISRVTFSLCLYAAAWLYAYRMPAKRKAILRLASWLYVTSSILGLVFARFVPETHLTAVHSLATSQPVAWTTSHDSSDQSSAFAVPFTVFSNHLIICLFLPWRFRQSIKPASVILAAHAALLLLAVATGGHWARGLTALLLVAVAFAPGSVWCWWRFSRFRTRFRLYYESSAYQKLLAELGNARRIHEDQLPAMRIDGPLRLHYVYEPMRQIGGDLLFVHPAEAAPTDKITAVLFDVTGHGVAAALFVNRIVGELERCFGENPGANPNDVLKAMNSHVYYTLTKHSMYVTALVAQVDINENSLCYASAGHPDGFVIRPGVALERLVSTTFMLGVIDPAEFTGDSVTTRFEKSDAMVMFTDGAFEARNIDSGEAIGHDGLQRLVDNMRECPCCDWPALVLSAVAAHRESPPEDDTLIAVVYRM